MISETLSTLLCLFFWIGPSTAFLSEVRPCDLLKMWQEPEELLVCLAGRSILHLSLEAERDLAASCSRRKAITIKCPALLAEIDAVSNGNPLDKLYALALLSVKCQDNLRGVTAAKRWARWWESFGDPNPFDVRQDEDKFLTYAVQRSTDLIPGTPELIGFEQHLLLASEGKIEWDPHHVQSITPVRKEIMVEENVENYHGLASLNIDARIARAKLLKYLAQDRKRILGSYNICIIEPRYLRPLDVLYHIAVTALECGTIKNSFTYANRWKLLWLQSHNDIPSEIRSLAEILLAYVIDIATRKYIPTKKDLQTDEYIALEFEAYQRNMAMKLEAICDDSSRPKSSEVIF